MSKHTPGPWRVERQNSSPTTGEWMIAGSKPGYLAEVRDCGSGDVSKNARLIAAAPELLEALILLLEKDYKAEDEIWVRAKGRATIAKATGEQQ